MVGGLADKPKCALYMDHIIPAGPAAARVLRAMRSPGVLPWFGGEALMTQRGWCSKQAECTAHEALILYSVGMGFLP